MTDAELCQESVNRSDLHTCASANVPQVGGPDVILSIRDKKRQGGKTIQNSCPGLRPGKALQKFLENETRRQKRLARFDRANQCSHRRVLHRRVAPECQRPDAGVDEQAQSRARPAL